MNPSIFGYVRTLEGENPVVVFINLGGDTAISARSILRVAEIPENARGRVLAATSTSDHNVDDIVSVDQVTLKAYDAIAFVVEPTPEKDSASTVIATFLIMIMSVLVILL